MIKPFQQNLSRNQEDAEQENITMWCGVETHGSGCDVWLTRRKCNTKYASLPVQSWSHFRLFFLGHLLCKNTHVPPWTVPFQRAFSRTAPWLSRRWLCAWERFLDFFVEARPLRPFWRDAGKRGTTCWKWKCLQKLLRNPELYYRGWKGRWVTTGIHSNDGFLPLTTAGLLRCMHEAKEYFHRLLLSDHHGSGEVPCLWLLDGEFFTVLPEKGLQGFHPVLPTGR